MTYKIFMPNTQPPELTIPKIVESDIPVKPKRKIDWELVWAYISAFGKVTGLSILALFVGGVVLFIIIGIPMSIYDTYKSNDYRKYLHQTYINKTVIVSGVQGTCVDITPRNNLSIFIPGNSPATIEVNEQVIKP